MSNNKETIYRSAIAFLLLLSGGASVAAWHNRSVSTELRYELTQMRGHSHATHAITADLISNLHRVEADRAALQLELGSLQRKASMAAHTAKLRSYSKQSQLSLPTPRRMMRGRR